jgi:hypothetical protein
MRSWCVAASSPMRRRVRGVGRSVPRSRRGDAFAPGLGRQRSRCVPDGAGHTETAEVVYQCCAADERRVVRSEPEVCRGCADEVGCSTAVPGEPGAAQIREVADGFKALIEPPVDRSGSERSADDDHADSTWR